MTATASTQAGGLVARVMAIVADLEHALHNGYEESAARCKADLMACADSADRQAAVVAGLVGALDHIGGLCSALRQSGPDPMDLDELSEALHEAVDTANAALRAMKEQP